MPGLDHICTDLCGVDVAVSTREGMEAARKAGVSRDSRGDYSRDGNLGFRSTSDTTLECQRRWAPNTLGITCDF